MWLRKRFRALGGESISFYKAWRGMQYDMNKVMLKFLVTAKVNASSLPPDNSDQPRDRLNFSSSQRLRYVVESISSDGI